jgi:hypothetical protein
LNCLLLCSHGKAKVSAKVDTHNCSSEAIVWPPCKKACDGCAGPVCPPPPADYHLFPLQWLFNTVLDSAEVTGHSDFLVSKVSNYSRVSLS